LFGVAALAVSGPTWAGAPTENVIQIAAGFRYGLEMNDGDLNPWGSGIGLQGGYTLPIIPVYLGGNFEYFFGGKAQVLTAEVEGHLWQATVEGGYDLGLGPIFVIRPKVGFGVASVSTKSCFQGICGENTDTKPVLAPGATFILMTGKVTLSLDARYDLIFADQTAKALILTAGIGF